MATHVFRKQLADDPNLLGSLVATVEAFASRGLFANGVNPRLALLSVATQTFFETRPNH